MSDLGIVGNAYVEVHARAAATLQREIQTDVDRAADRVSTRPQRPGQMAAFDDSAEGRAKDAAFEARMRSRVEGEKKIQAASKDTGEVAERVNRRTVSTQEGVVSGLARTAISAGLLAVVYGSVTSAVRAFLAAGDEGRLKNDEDVRKYRATSNALAELGNQWQRAKEKAGEYLATPFSPGFRKGLATIAEVLGNPTSTGAEKDARLAARFAEIDGDANRKTDAEKDRAVADARARLEASKALMAQEDKRAEARVRQLNAELEFANAADRVTAAQERLGEAQRNAAATGERQRRAQEALADAMQRVRDAIQAVADANQGVTEGERRVEEARRKVRVTSFETGSGSQATLDAIDDLQTAEFELGRQREEATDAVGDVQRAEREVRSARQETARAEREAVDAVKQARKELDDALRASAKVHADAEQAAREAAGETLTARDKLDLYSRSLEKFASEGGAGPAYRAELDRIKAALRDMPLGKSAEDIRLGTLAGMPQSAPNGGGLPTPQQVFSTNIANHYYQPVDPASIVREQAAQIGNTGSATRLVT